MKIILARASGSLLSLKFSQRQAEDVRTVADMKRLLSQLDTSALACVEEQAWLSSIITRGHGSKPFFLQVALAASKCSNRGHEVLIL